VRTDRLILRRWTPQDFEPFAAINADPAVMKYFRAPLDRTESDALLDRIEAGFEAHGFGLWAVEQVREPGLIGFVGLSVPGFEARFTPAVEVGWRLARSAWGNGFATEAAQRAIAAGFDDFGLDQVVSFTATTNTPSIAVMHRLGMTNDPAEDFAHPSLPAGHPLQRHVLYRFSKDSRGTQSMR
jgi:RimJ/RimL family protein N-acetyltransferase